jgi:hypothetical protein
MKYYPLVLFVLMITRCDQKTQVQTIPNLYDIIEDQKVRAVLERAINKAGGIEQWRAIKTISYTKRSKLLLEDASIESDITQNHKYTMSPQFSAWIKWENNGDQHRIQYGSGQSKQFRNDTLITKDPSQTVMSAIYTLGMPFKLLDDGAVLTYEGKTVIDSIEADVIKATYDPDENENHSTQDVWYYYFDVRDGNFLGAMVYHSPTYAFIQNLDFVSTTPVILHAHRKSYRTDSARNIQFLRAEFWYSDYVVD